MRKNSFVILMVLFMIFAISITTMAKTTLDVFAAYGGKDEIFSAFEEDTGIKVNYIGMSSGEVLARLRAEKGNPSADVWFGGGSDAFIAAKKEGLLQKYVSPEGKYIRDLFKDDDGYWYGVSLVTVNFIVNTDRCEEEGLEIPQTWEDVAQEEFRGEIMMSNPSISGTAYTILSGLIQHMGEEEGWEYFEELNKNIPYYAKRGSEPPQKAALGEVIVGLSPGTGVELKEEGYPVVNIMPKDGLPWWPAPMAILKGTDKLEAAETFVDWSLSARGQEILKKYCPRVPTRDGIEPPQALSGFKNAEVMDIDFERAGAVREEIVQKWQNNYAK